MHWYACLKNINSFSQIILVRDMQILTFPLYPYFLRKWGREGAYSTRSACLILGSLSKDNGYENTT